MAGTGTISNSPITTDSISSIKSTIYHFHLDYGEIVVGLRHISTSPFNINSCFLISKGRVAGILWPKSTYIKLSYRTTSKRVAGQTWPTSMISVINWGRVPGLKIPISKLFTTSKVNWGWVAGIKRPMSTTFIYQRHPHTLLLGTFITVVTTAGVIMAGPTILRS